MHFSEVAGFYIRFIEIFIDLLSFHLPIYQCYFLKCFFSLLQCLTYSSVCFLVSHIAIIKPLLWFTILIAHISALLLLSSLCSSIKLHIYRIQWIIDLVATSKKHLSRSKLLNLRHNKKLYEHSFIGSLYWVFSISTLSPFLLCSILSPYTARSTSLVSHH